MANENLVYEKKDGIAYITFNRPKVLNALNRKTVEELQRALLDARDDQAVRVLILTGAGEKAFVAGAWGSRQSARLMDLRWAAGASWRFRARFESRARRRSWDSRK